MNQLLDKFNDFMSITNYRIEYILEDDSTISFRLKQTDFPHLLGLHKLIDIPVIRQFNDRNNLVVGAKYINSKIRKEELLTESIVRKSVYFPTIEQRFRNFCKDNILTLSYSEVIIAFNASLIGSNLRASYILFEKRKQGYHHLCIAENEAGQNYVESFFYQPTDLYLRNQIIVRIKGVRIYDKQGNLYFEDTLFYQTLPPVGRPFCANQVS